MDQFKMSQDTSSFTESSSRSCVERDTRQPVCVRPLTPGSGTAIDPLVEEIAFVGWKLVEANPNLIRTEVDFRATSALFDRLVETVWIPGRTVLICEAKAFSGVNPDGLDFNIALGVTGCKGESMVDALALATVVRTILQRTNSPFKLTPVSPDELLKIVESEARHGAIVRQRSRSIEDPRGGDDIKVLSRWNPVANPWMEVVRLIMEYGRPIRVRSTLLSTELSLDDRQVIDDTLVRIHQLTSAGDLRPDHLLVLQRAAESQADVLSSFQSPLFVNELAIVSSHPVASPVLRAIASAFTSGDDVLRQNGKTYVAAQRLILGGYAIDSDLRGLHDALANGLPLRGGIGARHIVDVISLTESTFGLPIPVEAIPTISTTRSRHREIPPLLRDGRRIGAGRNGQDVCLPTDLAGRHGVVTGVPGSGKSTFLVQSALADVRSGQSFVMLDVHGAGADMVIGFLEKYNQPHIVFDVTDGATSQLSLTPKLRSDAGNFNDVSLRIERLVSAVRSSLFNEEWAGPRWEEHASAIFWMSATYGVSVPAAVAWYLDDRVRHQISFDPVLPNFVRHTLSSLVNDNDAGGVKSWVTSKMGQWSRGQSRLLLAKPGQGIDLTVAMGRGIPIIINLAGVSAGEAQLIGHVFLDFILQTGFDLGAGKVAYNVYVDEAHRFGGTPAMQRLLAEGRKFGFTVWLSTQSILQFPSVLADSAFGSAVNIAFRQGHRASVELASILDVQPSDLIGLPDLFALAKVAGQPTTTVALEPYEEAPPRNRLPITSVYEEIPPPKVKKGAIQVLQEFTKP